MSVRESLKRKRFGKKGSKGRLLLAPCPQGCEGVCQKMLEVPSVRSGITLPARGADLHNELVTICAIGG